MIERPTIFKFTLFFIVIALALGLRLTLSYFSVMNLPPSSDEALSVLLAESIAQGENYPLLFTGQPYQFPVEAYLMSPYIEHLNHNAFGARFQLFVLGFVAAIGFLSVTALALKRGDRWPTALLILIPSAYWLLHQSGYLVPQHAISAVFAAAVFYLAIKVNRHTRLALVLTALTGIVSGLSLSNHLLTISVVAGAISIITFSGNARLTFSRFPVFVCGLAIGLIPLIWAIIALPGAYEGISEKPLLSNIIPRLYGKVISQVLPGAMGFNPPFFGDYPARLGWSNSLRIGFAICFLSLIIPITIFRIKAFVGNTSKLSWPTMGWPDMFVIVTIASIALITINARGQSNDHRYLMPVVWSFPFLVGYAYSCTKKAVLVRALVAAFAVVLALFNFATSSTIIREWSYPFRIQKHADIPDIGHVQAWLQEEGIEYCYATFWLAYRFTYETNKKITCAPIYNERFINWPIPYKKKVDHENKIAYVMTKGAGAKFTFLKFEKILQQYGIKYNRKIFDPCKICDPLYVYYNFTFSAAEGERILSPSQFGMTTNVIGADTDALSDNETSRSWSPNKRQEKGQYIEINFDKSQYVQKIDLVHPLRNHRTAQSVRIFGRRDKQWVPLTKEISFKADRLRFEYQHPIFGEHLQTIRFEPIWVESIRIEVVKPRPDEFWALSEVRIGIQTEYIEKIKQATPVRRANH